MARVRLLSATRGSPLASPRSRIARASGALLQANIDAESTRAKSAESTLTTNLNNEVTRTSQVLDNTLLRTGRSWFVNDRRYTIALRGTF